MSDTLATPADPPADVDSSLDIVVTAYLKAVEIGEDLDRDAWLARHPAVADGLGEFFTDLDSVDRIAAPLRSAIDPRQPARPDGTVAAHVDGLETGVLGDFRLIREAGRGGMGVVYEAEQVSLGRRVALKVLPFAATMDPKQLQRFHNEAKAAASLHHEHVVPVYGVGCERGVHYYAMQFIDGHTLADVILHRGMQIADCQKRKGDESADLQICNLKSEIRNPTVAALSTRPDLATGRAAFRQAADWIAQAAEALEYAHSMGIVHRDVKPGNLMVDAAGKIWVADFGLARLGPDAGLTMSGDLLGTLRYMAPEQALAKHGLADHRVDVYGLGCTLYELLTGRPAVDGSDKAEIVRHIAFEEPVALRKLDKAIPAELETIALKCLAKSSSERYATASELAADLRRWLEHKTIKARPPSRRQRLDRWVRRHSAVVSATAAALLVGMAVSTWLAIKARNAERRATTEAAIARAVNDFLLGDLLGQFDSVPQFSDEFGGNPDLTVLEAIDRAAARVGERFQDQPLVEAAIRTVIGKGYGRQARHQLALAHFERAVSLRKAHLGLEHPDSLASMNKLAEAYSWAARHSDAIALRRQLLESRKVRLGPDHSETLSCARGLAYAYQFASRWDMSVPLLEQTLEKQRTICGPTHPETLATMHDLAMHYAEGDRLAESLALHQTLQETLKFTNGAELEGHIWKMMTFAQACQRAGKLDQADRLLREARELNQKREDSIGRRLQHARILGWLSLNLLLKEQYDEAEPLIRQAVATYEKRHAEDLVHFFLMTLHGAVLSGQRRYAEAEPLLLQGYEGMTQAIRLGVAGRQRAEAGEWVVRFYEATDQPEKAREWREKLAKARQADRDP